VERFDRRSLVIRGAGGAAALTLPAWRLVSDAGAAPDRRLAALRRVVAGPVIGRASPAYAKARLVYSERFDGVHPLGIVQPVSVADVREVLAWSRKYDVRPAVRSGGHSYGGYSTTTGLVVDLRRLSSIAVGAGGVATIGAGARLIDVESALASRGRAIPSGSCATVGIGGLALGGGVGLASRAFGTTSDNIVSLGIVTADGRYRTCSATENSDLFWACRGGGGGNFGVVTHFSFRTHPVSTVSYFFADWPWSQAAEVIGAWQAFAPHAPDRLFSICSLGTGGTTPAVRCFGQFLGDEQRLRAMLRPLTRVAGVRLTVGSSSYLDAQLRWAGCLGKTTSECHLVGETPDGTLERSAFRAKSDYMTAPLSTAARSTITAWIERAQQESFGSAALILDSYGGAINRVPAGATAFVHRNALCSGQYLAYWYHPANQAKAAGWLRGFYAAMRPYVSGFAYQNYIDPELVSWKRAYYAGNYARLRQIKKQVDPDWLFRFAQGIPPG
jgi:FAD/FMN-containing dehydrogenase